jgi:Transposase DDE domain
MSGSSSARVSPASFSLGEALSWGGTVALQPALPQMDKVAIAPGSLPSLARALEAVPEHRKPRGFRANQPPVLLIPALLLLIVGVVIGRRGYGGIAEWGRLCEREEPDVVDLLGFPQGRKPRTPAAATLFRLVRDLNLGEFQAALQGWLVETAAALHVTLPAWEQKALPEDQVALDGKTVRGASRRRGSTDFDTTSLHAVAAYVPALHTVLDQLVADGKGQELAAIKMLLGRLPLKGRVYTADALATQREVCVTIQEGGGDYLLPVKENQPALLADIQEAFSPSGAAGPGHAPKAGGQRHGESAAPDAARRAGDRGSGDRREGQARTL